MGIFYVHVDSNVDYIRWKSYLSIYQFWKEDHGHYDLYYFQNLHTFYHKKPIMLTFNWLNSKVKNKVLIDYFIISIVLAKSLSD